MPREAAARSTQSYADILDQMAANHRAALESTRAQLAEVPQQGQAVSLHEAGQLPVPSTPNSSAKDLVHKYGRESTPMVERAPAMEPEP